MRTDIVRKRAFTLIELLVVVAVVAILAAIAIPNYLHAQIRARLAHTVQDFRNLATVYEAYYADWQTYPMGVANDPSGFGIYAQLSTPIPYAAAIFEMVREPFWRPDVDLPAQRNYDTMFGRQDRLGFPANQTASIFARVPRDSWLIDSMGPDGNDDVLPTTYYPMKPPGKVLVYDPSNGLVSDGDLLRVGGAYVPVWAVPYADKSYR